jgi:cell division protein FtsB
VAGAEPLLAHGPVSRRLVGGAALLVVVGALTMYGVTAVLRVSDMKREMETMERDLLTLRARTEQLTKTVDRLRSDPAYIEKLAREDLGYVREGETVLKFPKGGNR